MMDNKKILSKRIAAGMALVALSGFVPKITKPVHAATATISATGTFTSGIKLTAGNNLEFGVIVPTGANGSVAISTAGVTTVSKAFINGGAPTNGTMKFAAGASKVVDITVVGLKNTLTLGSFGGAKTGTVNLPTVTIGGPLTTAQVFKIATTKQTNTLNSTTADIAIGGIVTWNGVAPIGTFATPITVTIAF